MRKLGFSIIELLISIMISSMLSVMIFGTFFQANRFTRQVDSFADIYTSAAVIQNQLERDIQGVFVPSRVFGQQEETKKDNQGQGAQPQAPTAEKKVEKKPLKKIFYATNRNDMLHEITFITNNPLQVYWSEHVGQAKPLIARVRYLMVEDKESKGRYSLMRQESYELEAKEFQPNAKSSIRAYVVADNIKQLSVEYFIEEPKDDTKEKSDKVEKKYKTSKDWNIEKGADDDKAKDQKDAMVPQFVRFTLTLWDNSQERDELFKFTVPVLADVSQLTERKSLKATAQKKMPNVQQTPTDRIATLRRKYRKRRPLIARSQKAPQAHARKA